MVAIEPTRSVVEWVTARSRWSLARRATSSSFERWPSATVDFDVLGLIAGLFERAGVSKMSRARVVMSVPSLATSIERRPASGGHPGGRARGDADRSAIAAAIGVGCRSGPRRLAVTVLVRGSEAAIISLVDRHGQCRRLVATTSTRHRDVVADPTRCLVAPSVVES